FVRRYIFISAAEHYRLENDPMNPLHVFAHKPNDVADSIVIEAIHDTNLQSGFHAGCSNVFKRAMLDFHVISNTPMFVFFFCCSVELEVPTVQPDLPRANCKVTVLGKPDPIRGDVKPVEPQGLCVSDRIKEDRGESCFAAGEENVDFALRFERNSSLE